VNKQQTIEDLQSEVDKLRAMLNVAETGMKRLNAYVTSPKYWDNPMVCSGDITLRLGEIENEIADLEFLSWGWAHTIRGRGIVGAWDSDDPTRHSYQYG
jgi:hypothetical protein